MLQCVVMCCSVLQCVAVCCSVLQRGQSYNISLRDTLSMTVSTENASSSKSTKSENSVYLVSHGTSSILDCGFIWICTEGIEFLDLVNSRRFVYFQWKMWYEWVLRHCSKRNWTIATCCNILPHTATHSNILQRTEAHCNTLQHTATHCNTLQHTATRCNTLQHTATNCNTLQHTDSVIRMSLASLQHGAVCCSVLQCA